MNVWFGRPAWQKFVLLTAIAIVLQLVASPDPVTLFDIAATPFTALIWLFVIWLLWEGYKWLGPD